WVAMFRDLTPWLIVYMALGRSDIRIDQAMNARIGEVRAPERPERASLLTSPLWGECARGLELYASALSWRIRLVLCAYGMLFLAGMSQSTGTATLVSWLLPLVSIVTALVMLRGLYLYARQPEVN